MTFRFVQASGVTSLICQLVMCGKRVSTSRRYAPEEMKGGKKLFEQIDRAIHMHDKLLIVLSKESIASNWVQTEIRRARKQEKLSGERKLFPIRLCDMETLKQWECFDTDSGRDIAEEVREYFIPDFSDWKKPGKFEDSFGRLCGDLQREGVAPANVRRNSKRGSALNRNRASER